jgi:hypothetical protein
MCIYYLFRWGSRICHQAASTMQTAVAAPSAGSNLMPQILFCLVHYRQDLFSEVIAFNAHWMSFIAYTIAFAGPADAVASSIAILLGITIDCAVTVLMATELGTGLCIIAGLTHCCWEWASQPTTKPAYVPKRLRGWNPLKRITKDCLSAVDASIRYNVRLVTSWRWNDPDHTQPDEDQEDQDDDCGPYADAVDKCRQDNMILMDIEGHRAIAKARLSIMHRVLMFTQALKGGDFWADSTFVSLCSNMIFSLKASTTAVHDHRYDSDSS